jgi:hypothetical protein
VRFALSTEQRELAASVHALLSSADVPAVSARWAAGDHEPGLGLLGRLAKVGVTELADFPVELVVVFEELGRHAVPGPLVESYAVAPALGVPGDLVTVALPPHVPYALDADVATPYVVDGEAGDVSAARVAAADAAWLAARAALQVHGAIGYTREHPMSWALLKVKALRSAWGTQTWHRRRVLTSLRSR